MPDILLNVPMDFAYTECHGPRRTNTLGVFIHSTRSGRSWSLVEEYTNTVGYFLSSGEASAQLVVGPFRVARVVGDDYESWHAQENNKTHLGIEVCQPRAYHPFSEFQYMATAEATYRWHRKYGFPLERVMSQAVTGIIGHEDSEQGKRGGKSDPGQNWNWGKFLGILYDHDQVERTPAVPVFKLHPEIAKFLAEHPEIGAPRHDSVETWATGDHYVYCGSSAKYPHGVVVVYRNWLKRCAIASWD